MKENNMKIWDIKKITIPSWDWVQKFQVWYNDIVEINDKSIEYDDSIHFIYEVIDNWENIVARTENCPVVIEYVTK